MSKLMRRNVLVLWVALLPVLLMAQGAISGRVQDKEGNPIIGANIMVSGTSLGAATASDGSFTITGLASGDYTVVATAIGYKRDEGHVSVTEDAKATINFTLDTDVLGMSDVVVTGVANPVSKLESSVAITTLDKTELELRSPRGAADFFKAIPGFYTESSGGHGNANIMARGLPNSGGLRYVQLQEDGLPVFEYGDLMFGNTDIWLRLDLNVDRIEGVRGGSASILTSNAPGGIINVISKTGGPEFSGTSKVTVGDFGLFRNDLEFGGPISKNIQYHIGGYYRRDNGIRPTGYSANEGGQIKANATYYFNNGYVRINGKYLNDRTVGYLPIPLTGDDPKGIDGGLDPNYGTMASVDMLNLHVFSPTGTEVIEDLSDGMNPNVWTFGGELLYDLGDNWTIKNTFKKSSIDGQFNAIYPFVGPMTADEYAADKGLTDYTYEYAHGYDDGKAADGLVAEAWWWDVDIPLQYFTNNFKLSKSFGNLNLTAAYYFSENTVKSVWWWHRMLVDIHKEHPRMLNLKDNTTGTYLTTNGFSHYGDLFYKNYSATTTINTPFINAEYKAGALTLDGGLRFDNGTIVGWTEKDATYTYDVNGDGDTTAAETDVYYGTGEYIPFNYSYSRMSWSFGANYRLNENMAAFGRLSNGTRAPADRTYAFGATESTSSGFGDGVQLENITQGELGLKYNSRKLAVFGTLFYSKFDDIKFVDLTANGEVEETYNTTSKGLELELISNWGNLNLNFIGTFQDLRYNGWVYNVDTDGDGQPDKEISFDGNQIQRMPKVYFTFRPSYSFGDLGVNLVVQYFGRRFTSPDNVQELPAFTQINAGLTYALGNDLTFSANVQNLTNVVGLTEGNPSAGLAPGDKPTYYFARPILGRSITASLTYSF